MYSSTKPTSGSPSGHGGLSGFNGLGLGSIVGAILAPFAVSIEVFVRKDMGQRYFTYGTFLTGLLVIGLFRVFQYFSNTYWSIASTIMGWDSNINEWLYRIWMAYIVMGCYHFFYQWYREKAGIPIHSRYMGDSRLFFIGKVILALINRFISAPIKVFSYLLPAKDRNRLNTSDIRFSDYRGFTYSFIEPLTVFIIGFALTSLSSLLGLWLMFSSFILAIHSSVMNMKSRDAFLDMRDAQIFSSELQSALKNTSETLKVPYSFKQGLRRMAERAKDEPEIIEQMRMYNPSVAAALETMNADIKSQPLVRSKQSTDGMD